MIAPKAYVRWGFFIPAFVCFLALIFEEVRLIGLPAYLFDENYFAAVQVRDGIAVGIFLLAIIAIMLVIPAAVLYFEGSNFKINHAIDGRLPNNLPKSILEILFLECVLLLEASFAVTSHTLSTDNIQDYVVYQLLPRISFGGIRSYDFRDWDYCCLALIVVSMSCIFLILARKSSYKISLLQSLRVVALLLLPLEIEILFFDRAEFFIRVMQIQSDWTFGWFTNADLFCVVIATLCVTTFLGSEMKFNLRTISK